jgi:predicted nuclease with TOPRIM domain
MTKFSRFVLLDLLTNHTLLQGMAAEKMLLDDNLARLSESNKELVEKNDQLDKELKDEVARLTSENTKLKEQVTKLDKDFSSKLSTTQLLIFFTIIHHTQHGLVLECSHTPEHKDTPGGADQGEGPLGVQVRGNGARN